MDEYIKVALVHSIYILDYGFVDPKLLHDLLLAFMEVIVSWLVLLQQIYSVDIHNIKIFYL